MKNNPLIKMKNWFLIYYKKKIHALSLIKMRQHNSLQKPYFKNDVIGADMKKTLTSNKGKDEKKEIRETHVADLSTGYCLPILITCFAIDENSDPNLRITHYPPSNALH